jgi:hypothetical protein
MSVSSEAGLELLLTVDLVNLLVCGQSAHLLSEAMHSLPRDRRSDVASATPAAQT